MIFTKSIDWSPGSWRNFEILQQPAYSNLQYLNQIEERLAGFPPLVFAGEVENLRQDLAKVSVGEGFLLQGGDCAETFEEHSADNIRDFFRVFLEMSAVLTFSASVPIIKLGRIAGQFAKPRSSSTERRGDVELPIYRGDIINGIEFDEKSRVPDPQRMIMAYRQSASTLNLLRAFSTGGFANLSNVRHWALDFAKRGRFSHKYEILAERISEAIDFICACGIDLSESSRINQTVMYTSHESLLLVYEEALTRIDSMSGRYYGLSGHLLWIGDRTRNLNQAHVEYVRGIRNPIGIKCGPSIDKNELIDIIKTINPNNEIGKVVLICRFGKDAIRSKLPDLIKHLSAANCNVVWSCDPCHGNTVKSANGFKTRRFEDILSEVAQFFDIHRELKTFAGGIHLEMTGKPVTECTGGRFELDDDDLSHRYHTHCDPRLNADQALELAFLVSEQLTIDRKVRSNQIFSS